MMRWPSIAAHGVIAPLIALCVALAIPLAAQQDVVPAPQPGASATPASPASAVLAGPRLRPEWRPVEPTILGSSSAAPMAGSGGSHTVTVTTLVLVLVVIIAVLVIVK